MRGLVLMWGRGPAALSRAGGGRANAPASAENTNYSGLIPSPGAALTAFLRSLNRVCW